MKKLDKIRLLFWLLNMSLITSNYAQQTCFTGYTNFPDDSTARFSQIISADFNGNGKADLATAHAGSYPWLKNHVSIMLGDGMGNFGAAAYFKVKGSPKSIISADFNGDGKTDLATANGWQVLNYTDTLAWVSVLLGDGLASFGAAANFYVGSTMKTLSATSVTSADFNGDGKTDLAAINSWMNTVNKNVAILLGNGLGGFSAPAYFEGSELYANSIISADFNGDGKADLAMVSGSGYAGYENVSVLLGNGSGAFGAPAYFPVNGSPQQVISGNFNGDDKVDLAVVNLLNDKVSVLLGNGLGGFGVAADFTVGSWPTSITSADFNGDGITDLATSNSTSANVSVLLGDGIGGFVAAANPGVGAYPSSIPASITNADFNGDGKADLGVANPTGNVSVLLNCNNSTGLTNLTDAQSISVYPNPSDGKFSIESNEGQGTGTSGEVEIYNVLGKRIMTAGICKFNQPLSLTINLTSHPDGIYFIKINSEVGSAAQKIIIQK